MDKAHEWTDDRLDKMEKHLTRMYRIAEKELKAKAEKALKAFEAQDKKMKAKLAKGEITKDQYTAWAQAHIMRGKVYRDLQKQMTENLLNVDKIALDYVNGNLPQVYAENYNQLAPSVDGLGGYSFTLTDAQTVKNLAESDKSLLPYKTPKPDKDRAWTDLRINAEVLQGILQGESMGKIAKRMSKVCGGNLASSVRTARTCVTSAENRGRMDSFKQAEKDGIILEKRWIATSDGRTRHWHRSLNGVTLPVDEPFQNVIYQGKRRPPLPDKIMYPGDPNAHPANVYNCRCTLVAEVKGFDFSKANIAPAAPPQPKAVEKQAPDIGQEELRARKLVEQIYEARRKKFKLSLLPAEEVRETNFFDENVSLKGVDPEIAQKMMTQLSKLSKRFYSCLQGIKVGSKEDFLGSGAVATTFYANTISGSFMEFNPLKINNISRIREMSKKGWSVKINDEDAPIYVITHEFAHTLLNVKGSLKNYANYDIKKPREAQKKISTLFSDYEENVTKLQREVKQHEYDYIMGDETAKDKYYKSKSELDKIKISDYSLMDEDEFMAESFAQMELGVNKSEYAEKVFKILEELFSM